MPPRVRFHSTAAASITARTAPPGGPTDTAAKPRPRTFTARPRSINLRASVLLVAMLVLAGCSSAISSSSSNPQTQNGAAELLPTQANHLTLRFENSSAYSLLFMDVDARKSICIASVEPSDIQLYESQIGKVDIIGDDQGSCKDGTREVHFSTALVQIGGGRTWKGDLDVRYDPQLSAWEGRLYEGDHNVDLCTDPPGFLQGTRLEENELISFHFCKRRHQ